MFCKSQLPAMYFVSWLSHFFYPLGLLVPVLVEIQLLLLELKIEIEVILSRKTKRISGGCDWLLFTIFTVNQNYSKSHF